MHEENKYCTIITIVIMSLTFMLVLGCTSKSSLQSPQPSSPPPPPLPSSRESADFELLLLNSKAEVRGGGVRSFLAVELLLEEKPKSSNGSRVGLVFLLCEEAVVEKESKKSAPLLGGGGFSW